MFLEAQAPGAGGLIGLLLPFVVMRFCLLRYNAPTTEASRENAKRCWMD